MIRPLFAAAVLGGLLGAARADDESKKKGSLAVGDAAPAVKADKWLHGAEVKGFEPGKVYVVEFWATWCGPCIVMMPHLGELQQEFRDKGVTVIGFSAEDPNNSAEKVAEFVKKRGPKLGYTFAFQGSKETYDAFMTAAGQNGIPCSFVVDKGGKVAFIGHPMFLDGVLPKVVAGTWDPATGKEEVAKLEKAFEAAFKATQDEDPAAGLKKLGELEAASPGMDKIPYLVGPKLVLMAKAKRFDELKGLAEKLLAKAEAGEDTGAMGTLARALTDPAAKGRKELVAVGVRAAEGMVKAAGEQDLAALVTAARTLDAAGDRAKAKGYAEKAVAAAPSANVKAQVERLLKPILGDGKPEEKKDGGQ